MPVSTPIPPEMGSVLNDVAQQLTILGLTLGCALKSVAISDPQKAEAIEDNLRLLMREQDIESWQPRAKALLDLMYSALQERSADE